MPYNEDDCTYSTSWSKLDIEAVLSELDPDRITRAGCRVLKHPDCCVLCAANNDCRLLPVHYNCLVGSTRVSAPVVSTDVALRLPFDPSRLAASHRGDGGVATATTVTETEGDFGRINMRAVSVREYVGDVVTIRTASGNELAGTPNHPIATRHGWVALADLRVGDHVLRSTGTEWELDGVNPDVDDIPPTIEQVAKSFPVALDAVPTAAEDFHGDGSGSDVHVVLTDGLLVDHVESLCAKHLAELDLRWRAFADSGALTTERMGFKAGIGPDCSTDSIVRSPSQVGPFLGRGLGHANVHGFTPPAGLDSELGESLRDPLAADAEGFCESLNALAFDVAEDEILYVDKQVFTGHVFNLETVEGWYVANSIITHNCRCKPEGYLEIDIAAATH